MILGDIDLNFAAMAPALILLMVAALGSIWSLFVADSSKTMAMLSYIGLGMSALFNLQLFLQGNATGNYLSSFGLQYLADAPAVGFNFVILIGTALAVMMSFDYLKRTELDYPEFYPLMLLSACGAMIMAAAGDLITLVLGLEIMSLAVYVLSAWRQNSRESEEAGMKYFLLGAFASAFLIYGIALIYGATGSFTYGDIAAVLTGDGFNNVLYAGLGGIMLLAGLGFKVAFAPFHQWAPDVYTGAPTSVTAFMSVVVKAAAFAALFRVFNSFFTDLPAVLTQVFVVMIVFTLVVGNLGALLQQGLKRMLAYSAVAHAGYLGLAVLASDTVGTQAAVWYLTAYALMNAGAFAVLTQMTDKNDYGDALERFAGLGRTRPGLAISLSIFLLSLAGIPLFAGFVGKILVFQAAIGAGYIGLAVLGILTSIVAVVYYIRPLAYMWFRDSEYDAPTTSSNSTNWAIAVAAFGTVLLGIFPGWWYSLVNAGKTIVAGM